LILSAADVGLCFSTGGSITWAVRHASLSVGKGQMVMILGPSGSGKSSLLYLLSGLRSASEGEVRYGEQLLSGGNKHTARRLRFTDFGFVYQQHFLIGYLTATENVCVGRSRQYLGHARNLLCELGLESRVNAYPAELSYGQRQRVALARALVHSPRIVFADEPTASVDSKLSVSICRILRDYCDQGGACVMVTHDESLRSHADGLYLMHDGILSMHAASAGE